MQNVIFVNAQQIKTIYKFKDTKDKKLSTNGAIWFNKISKTISRYPNILISKCMVIILNITKYGLNQELRFIYEKTQKLNE
jgi:hypothetical protein